jgi:hypothetical protein
MASILVATDRGLHDVAGDDPPAFEGRRVTFLAPGPSGPLAIVDGLEIWAADGGWHRVAMSDRLVLTCLAFTDRWLVGTSEGHLLHLTDGGDLVPIRSFDDVTGRDDWFTPWGGPPDTRSMSEWDDDVYVNVHVGGIVRTDDGGGSWTPTIDIEADVHQVTTAEGLVLAAAAGGLAVSADRGDTWHHRTDGLEHHYARAVTVIGNTVLVSTSRGPRGGDAAVYRAGMEDGTFERCTAGLPGSFDGNIDSHCLDAPPDGPAVCFGTADGRVFRSSDEGATWQQLAADLPPVRRVLVLP